MLIYLLSKLVCLFFQMCYVIPYLQYLTHGNWAKVIMLLYFVALAYGMTELLVMKQI